jgi:oligopeptidase B
LFAAVLAGVPFVDAIVTMADDTIPLVSTEWHEWGNPNEYKCYEYMKTYSPIDNIKSQRYPPILLSCGLNDYRVQYWEVLKYSQRCRQYNTNYLETIMKCELDEGHTGAMDRYRHIRDIANEQNEVTIITTIIITITNYDY